MGFAEEPWKVKLADDREKDGGTSGTAVEGALDDGGRSPPPPSPEGGGGAADTPNDIFIAPTKEHTEQALRPPLPVLVQKP